MLGRLPAVVYSTKNLESEAFPSFEIRPSVQVTDGPENTLNSDDPDART